MSTAPKPQMGVQDPVKVDSKHYKVELENEQVRVLRVNYGAHEKSEMHSHPDSVAIFQNDTHCRFTLSRSPSCTPTGAKNPTVSWLPSSDTT